MILTFGSLFAGIGGLDLGLERADMTCRWQVEIDPFCQRVLAKHWPDVPRYGDIKELTGHELEPVDLICGGFPCQPVSIAGRRRAQDDQRWLWPDFARIVRVVRPRYVLVENVTNITVRGMSDVLGDLAALGYRVESECLPAAAFGAPHIRDRVWVVAYTTGARCDEGPCAPSGPLWHEARRTQSQRLGCQVAHPGFQRHGPPEDAIFTRGNCPIPSSWWLSEPDVGRVADGVPARVERLRALGNAVVPQVAEYIGRLILERHAAR